MEGQDVDDDGSKHQQTEVAGFRNGDEDSADDFKHFDEREITGWI